MQLPSVLPLSRALLSGALLSGLLAPAAAADTSMPDLLRKALTPANISSVYAFEFTDTLTGGGAGIVRGRIDPTRSEGDRVTIIEATGDETDLRKIDKRYEENADGDIWCDQLAGVDGRITDRGAQAGGHVFAFTPKARAEASGDERKLYKQLAAEVTVDPATAIIKSYTARLPKPWKPNVLAKISHMNMTGRCMIAPNGRAYQAEMTMTLRGSAVGSSFEQGIRRTITNLTATASAG